MSRRGGANDVGNFNVVFGGDSFALEVNKC